MSSTADSALASRSAGTPPPSADVATTMSRSLRWTGPGRIAGRGLAFLFQVVLGRALGPAGFGVYSLGFTIIDVLKQFGLLGLQNGVVKFGARHLADEDWGGLRQCFRISNVAVLGAGSIMAALLWTASTSIAETWLHEPTLTLPLRLFAIGMPLYAWMILVQYWAWALRRVELDVLVNDLIQPGAAIALVATALFLGLGLPFVVGAWAASCAIAAGTGWLLYQRILAAFPPAPAARYDVRGLFRVSLPILLVGFSYILMGHIDKLMLAHFRDATSVGIYTAAFRLSRQMGVIQGAMAPIFAPLVSALDHRDDRGELKRVYHLVTRWILVISLPVVVVSMCFGDAILSLFGEGFRVAWPLLVILLTGQVINLSGGVAMQFLQMTGEQDRDLKIILIGLGLNIGLNLVLITRFAEMGAAVATALAFTAISLSRVVAVRKKYDMWPVSRSCLKPLAAAAVIAALGLVARPLVEHSLSWTIGAAVTMALVYLGTLVALGLPEEDTRIFRGKLGGGA